MNFTDRKAADTAAFLLEEMHLSKEVFLSERLFLQVSHNVAFQLFGQYKNYSL